MNNQTHDLKNAVTAQGGRLGYEAIIIGAGQGGGPLAGALAKAGRRVALVESTHVGGSCINEGCTPTKTMIASAEVAAKARRGADYGVSTGSVRVELERVRERKRSVVQMFREGSRASLERIEKLDLIFGSARFSGPGMLEVTGDGDPLVLESPMIFVNTGARPTKLDIPGVNEVDCLDSTSIMELGTLPSHLLVVGGGYVGVEFGQMFRRFGSDVTIVQMDEQLLGREDADVSEQLEQILREDGIEIITEAQAQRVERTDDGLALTVSRGGEETRLSGSHLLVAIGRTPNTTGLDLHLAGVKTNDGGFVEVDEQLRTSAPGVWALGDVKGGPAFTHISYDDYRLLRDQLLDGGSRTTTGRQVPYTIFTDPQLGRVGMTENEARRSGRNVGVATIPAGRVARAIETDNTRGSWKAVVDLETEEVLGAAILGHEGGEVMSAIEIAMMGGLSYKDLRDGVFAHPTYVESLNNLFARVEPVPSSASEKANRPAPSTS